MKLGFFMFIKSIPFIIAYLIVIEILDSMPLVDGLAQLFLALFIIPILSINFMNKMTVASFFEFRILDSVFTNFGDYIKVILKSILLGLIFIIMILVLVGLPAGFFTQDMFLADFYRRRVKSN